ncbi:hypothetical protein [Hydrogenophaga sp.]|uniref:hypothetical protein n=1 Tax=Hydrogenophaga sp. TaxID=1904254 RepID=UPI002737116F|nr:hypothetical protein [Hydrogenophaga sp.]MDP3108663.1 hypothetical protein [Hydrogenophaga sp.]
MGKWLGCQVSTKPPRTATAIFEKGFKEPFLRSSERPFVKLLNWYTGFGKTYTAAAFSIELFIKCDVIPVFIAPLQSLVAGFSEEVVQHQKSREYADEIEAAVLARGAQVPVHRLYSIEYHLNDRSFFQACLALVAWLEHHRDVSVRMEVSAKQAETDKGMRARLNELRQKAMFCEQSSFLGMSPSDDTYEDTRGAYIKAAQRARSLADSMVWKLIQLDIETRSQKRDDDRLMGVREISELVRRLHPLQAFLDNPGIIVSTASKAQVGHKVYGADGKGGFKAHKFDNLPLFLEELNRDDSPFGRMVSGRPDSARVVTFVDEEEDSYWYLFDQRKSVVNSGGRNDLNLVITEFFQYFDLKWPMAFEELRRDGPRLELATKVYENLESFAKVSQAVEDDFVIEADRTGAKYIADLRRVEILRTHLTARYAATASRFNDTELLTVLNQLHDRNDVHAAFKRFRQKARVLQRIRDYILDIKPPEYTTYETFRDLYDLVANKKYFTMSRSTYGEVQDQPGQTFFTESASVMDTEFLRQVELKKDTAHQTIRLQYHDGEIPLGAYTLLDYLKLVVFMAKVLAQTTGEDVIEMSKSDQERYPSLDRFRQDVRRLFESKAASEGLATESNDRELLTDSFLFQDTKSVVTLEESRVQAEEYNMTADVSLTLTITSLRATPEEDIVRALGRTNGVYLMSATGGLDSASSGAFNTKHLRRCIEARGGYFAEMGDDELEVVGARAEEMLGKRERKVFILDDGDPASTFGVSTAYKGLLHLFESARPKKEEPGYAQMNRHKRNELAGLVASLDRLLSSGVRSGLVLCQTTMHARKCLMRLANSNTGLVRQMDATGDHFVVQPKAIPTYREYGVQEEVTVILYSAGRFRNKDRSKTGALQENDDQGQFNRELEDALDISRRKVLLWSAYASASRGINFLTKQNGKERDFELFCLLNDPYYTRHTRPGTSGFSMEMFQSFAQVLRDENENWAAMSKGDLLFEYSRNRWRRLRKEHVIDITRTVFQALGRGERRPDAEMPCQHLYVSSEAARMVHLGLRHAPELRRRASPAQRSVLAQLGRHNKETAIFETEPEREAHHLDSLKKAVAFRRFTSETPRRFRSDSAARNLWDRLFDSMMFSDPLKYLERLEEADVPFEYIRGCFLEVPARAEAYSLQVAMAGLSETVVTDAEDGTDAYNWIGMVAPEGLVSHLSSKTQGHLKEWRGFKLADKTKRLIPQPWFVTEIMKGYIAELEFEMYVGAQFNVWPKQLALGGGSVEYLQVAEHPLYAELYQLFDYYLVPEPNVLVAVDLKNWARSTDSLKKIQLQEEAQKKHERLRELMPNTTVHALYVNLYGAHKFSLSKPAVGTIRFMSLFVPTTGTVMWMPNANLRDAVLGK